MSESLPSEFWSQVARVVVVVVVAFASLPFVAWVESLRGRRARADGLSAHGVGPRGAWTALATALKLVEKRAPRAPGSDRLIHAAAPVLALIPTLMVLAVLPIGVAQSSVPVGMCLALFLLSTAAVALAGMASANRLVLLAAVRLVTVRVVVVVVVGIAALAGVRAAGSASLDAISRVQSAPLWGALPAWGVVIAPTSFIAALVAMAVYAQQAMRARTEPSLAPSWIGEATGPVLLGHRVFESLDLVACAALLVCLFAGGGDAGPLPPVAGWIVKIALMLVLLVWVRNRLPAWAPASAVRLCWLVLMPLAFAGVMGRELFQRLG